MGDIRLLNAIERLVEIVGRLRGEGGCPWDRAQTHATLRPYVIEEAHEVVEALDSGDARRIRDELGDLLFQVVLHAELGRERGEFDLGAVAEGLAAKLLRRHPHVFGDETAANAAAVEVRWEALKRLERAEAGGADREAASALEDIPLALPALARAQKSIERAARVGFDWPRAADALAKLDEERAELGAAIAAGDRGAIEHELGDLLLAATSVARAHGVGAEDALRAATRRFAARFGAIERAAAASGRDVRALSPDEMLRLWAEAKAREG